MRYLELNAREALGGDLVICKCARRPSIIPINGRRCMLIDDGSGSAAAGAAVAAASLTQMGRRKFDDRYILRDADGTPVCNARYTLQRGQGSPERGTTDDQGHTHLLATASSEDDIHIYMGNAA